MYYILVQISLFSVGLLISFYFTVQVSISNVDHHKLLILLFLAALFLSVR